MSLYTDLLELFTPYANAIKSKADASSVYTKQQVDDAIDAITIPVDYTLTHDGEAADAKTVGDALDELNDALDNVGEGLSAEARAALLECFHHVYFTDSDKDYYGNLENALDLGGVISLSATFTQGNNVITKSDKLDDLKNFLTVTATYSNGNTSRVNNYTLSGTLSSATSTINVAFGGKRTSFNVSVKTLPSGYTEKNYITSDKSQYIATDIAETDVADCGFRVRVSAPEYDDRAGHLFSSLNVQCPNLWYYQPTNVKNLSGKHKGNGTRTFAPGTSAYVNWSLNTIYTIESFLNGSDDVVLDGEKVFEITKGTDAVSTNKIAILGYGYDPSASKWRTNGNTYFIKVFNQDMTKKYDFVPCVNSSNVVGLYDLVNNQFYAPTVGTLIAG